MQSAPNVLVYSSRLPEKACPHVVVSASTILAVHPNAMSHCSLFMCSVSSIWPFLLVGVLWEMYILCLASWIHQFSPLHYFSLAALPPSIPSPRSLAAGQSIHPSPTRLLSFSPGTRPSLLVWRAEGGRMHPVQGAVSCRIPNFSYPVTYCWRHSRGLEAISQYANDDMHGIGNFGEGSSQGN